MTAPAPEPTMQQLYQLALAAVIDEARKVADATPDEYPALVEALQLADTAAAVLLTEHIAAAMNGGGVASGMGRPSTPEPAGDHVGLGMYL